LLVGILILRKKTLSKNRLIIGRRGVHVVVSFEIGKGFKLPVPADSCCSELGED